MRKKVRERVSTDRTLRFSARFFYFILEVITTKENTGGTFKLAKIPSRVLQFAFHSHKIDTETEKYMKDLIAKMEAIIRNANSILS